jgi:hypothetical protein
MVAPTLLGPLERASLNHWLVYSRYQVSFPGGKAWPGRDADHSPPSSAKAVNE